MDQSSRGKTLKTGSIKPNDPKSGEKHEFSGTTSRPGGQRGGSENFNLRTVGTGLREGGGEQDPRKGVEPCGEWSSDALEHIEKEGQDNECCFQMKEGLKRRGGVRGEKGREGDWGGKKKGLKQQTGGDRSLPIGRGCENSSTSYLWKGSRKEEPCLR